MLCTSSSTASSAATEPEKPRSRLHFLFFLLSLPSFAGGQLCDVSPAAVMAKWSSDTQVKNILRLSRCPERASVVVELQKAYLKRLNLETADPDPLFRVLVAGGAEVDALAKVKLNAAELLAKTQWIGKVAIVGASPQAVENLKALLSSLGPTLEKVWDESVLYKVAVTRQKRMAAFVPQWASLSLSPELLEEPTALHRFVVMHELAHVAETSAKLRGEDWEKEFAVFSKGPKPKTLAPQREDVLTADSKGSVFSILPDPVLDGYVLAKAYRETKKQKSASEDMADSAAAFLITPERFCWAGKPLAPKKYEWVRQKLFPQTKELQCERKTP